MVRPAGSNYPAVSSGIFSVCCCFLLGVRFHDGTNALCVCSLGTFCAVIERVRVVCVLLLVCVILLFVYQERSLLCLECAIRTLMPPRQRHGGVGWGGEVGSISVQAGEQGGVSSVPPQVPSRRGCGRVGRMYAHFRYSLAKLFSPLLFHYRCLLGAGVGVLGALDLLFNCSLPFLVLAPLFCCMPAVRLLVLLLCCKLAHRLFPPLFRCRLKGKIS